jgi:type II secretory pathway pseudopilin PulG
MMHRRRRTGITLYEVVLSLAIFAGALAALGPLATTGSKAAVRTKLETQAVLRCESKLAEVLAGIEPLVSVSGGAFEDLAPGWTWDLAVNAGPRQDLLIVEVAVVHTNANGTQDASHRLVRLLRDPNALADLQEQMETQSGSGTTTTSGSGSSGGSSSSSGSGTGSGSESGGSSR